MDLRQNALSQITRLYKTTELKGPLLYDKHKININSSFLGDKLFSKFKINMINPKQYVEGS